MQVTFKKATVAHLKEFCDANGLDYSDSAGLSGLPLLNKLRSLVTQSGLVRGDSFSVDSDEPAPALQVTRAAPAPAAASAGAERLSADTLAKLTDALWPKGSIAEATKPKDPAEVARLCVEYRDQMRADPRNPFPGKYVGDMVTMMIQKQDAKVYPGGDQPVFESVNGKDCTVNRGEWADVPYELACVLDHSKQTLFEDNGREGIKKIGEVHAYPVNFRDKPAAA